MTARSGRHLAPVPAAAFLPCVPASIAAGMQAGGLRLVGETRPYLNHDGTISVRLVWRGQIASATTCFRLRGDISDDLLQVLVDAMCRPPNWMADNNA